MKEEAVRPAVVEVIGVRLKETLLLHVARQLNSLKEEVVQGLNTAKNIVFGKKEP